MTAAVAAGEAAGEGAAGAGEGAAGLGAGDGEGGAGLAGGEGAGLGAGDGDGAGVGEGGGAAVLDPYRSNNPSVAASKILAGLMGIDLSSFTALGDLKPWRGQFFPSNFFLNSDPATIEDSKQKA